MDQPETNKICENRPQLLTRLEDTDRHLDETIYRVRLLIVDAEWMVRIYLDGEELHSGNTSEMANCNLVGNIPWTTLLLTGT